jgi:hypothetical protein
MQVQRIAWEAIKQGYQEGEKQIGNRISFSPALPILLPETKFVIDRKYSLSWRSQIHRV